MALRASGPGADAERRDALGGVVEHAERVDRAIDALLAVARQEIDPARGTVDLAAIAREFDGLSVSAPPTCRSPRAIPRSSGARSRRSSTTPAATRTNGSAELSSAGGKVRVAIRDDGPGLDAGLGERAFEPGVRGAD